MTFLLVFYHSYLHYVTRNLRIVMYVAKNI